tara:strand:- start:101 stop:640 length:540 start_codon:yes stop_codon:yes gene_type:complete
MLSCDGDMKEISLETVLQLHKLKYNWILWAHLPQDPDWSLDSYKIIGKATTIEEAISITRSLPVILVKNCMLFFMREGVKPHWEDAQNRNGGCFSYKILDKNIIETWKLMCYVVSGNSLSKNNDFNSKIMGITISPKKKFCIIKIWMSDCTNQNPAVIIDRIADVQPNGCLFKKHVPEY